MSTRRPRITCRACGMPQDVSLDLIAAAPRMLALLQQAPSVVGRFEALRKWDEERRAILRDVEEQKITRDKAPAAIAQAKEQA